MIDEEEKAIKSKRLVIFSSPRKWAVSAVNTKVRELQIGTTIDISLKRKQS